MGVINCTLLIGHQNEGHTSKTTAGHVVYSFPRDSEGPAFVTYDMLLLDVQILQISSI